jgi:hypothetical protein
MNAKGVDMVEQIEWWDALDVLSGRRHNDVEKGLQMARVCLHPDAQWFSSMFPAGVAVTTQVMAEVMRSHADDPRAMYLSVRLSEKSDASDEGERRAEDTAVLSRSARMGYARAQAHMCWMVSGTEALSWAQRAAANGDREGMFQLASRHHYGGIGCDWNFKKAMVLYGEAARCGHVEAMETYGRLAFDEMSWERYWWQGRAAMKGFRELQFCDAVVPLFKSFEEGENARILHTVGPVLKAIDGLVGNADSALRSAAVLVRPVRHIIEMYEAMTERARRAIARWALVGRRCGLVKDVRVMVSKMAWEEAWRWNKRDDQRNG